MYFILRTEIKLGKLQKLDSSSKVDDVGVKPPPPWKTNDVKVSNYDCQLTNSIRSLIQIKTTKIHTKFTSFSSPSVVDMDAAGNASRIELQQLLPKEMGT